MSYRDPSEPPPDEEITTPSGRHPLEDIISTRNRQVEEATNVAREAKLHAFEAHKISRRLLYLVAICSFLLLVELLLRSLLPSRACF